MKPLVFTYVPRELPGLSQLSAEGRREAEVLHRELQDRVEDGITQLDFEAALDALGPTDQASLREALRTVVPLYWDDLSTIAANEVVMLLTGSRPEPDPHAQLLRLLDLPTPVGEPSQEELAQTLFEQYFQYASQSHRVGDEAVALMAERLNMRRTHSDRSGLAFGVDPSVVATLTDVLLRPENRSRLHQLGVGELSVVQRQSLPPAERDAWMRLQSLLSATATAAGMSAYLFDTDHDGRLGERDTVVAMKDSQGQPPVTVPLGDANLLWFLAQ